MSYEGFDPDEAYQEYLERMYDALEKEAIENAGAEAQAQAEIDQAELESTDENK